MKEVRYIMDCARRGDSRVVSFGVLLFFSTLGGDAWVLDIEDGSALCLMKECEPLQVVIEETSGNFSIAWEGAFAIDDDLFIVSHGSRSAMFGGYPTAEIERIIKIATAAQARAHSAAGDPLC
jgi:hypothetical protein